ncbi:cyclin-D-binding Myb-like transcription factor 1 isoform X2 [Pollicipes pollicipes]|nr:cyclin-D-binding Myb-like transcription factor 1 isoform X2 [Pollicipes pollicipes]
MADDEQAMVQLVAAGGPEYISGLGYTFQLQDGSQVLIRTDSKPPDVCKSEEPSSALGTLVSHEACGGGQSLVLDAVPDGPLDSGEHVAGDASAAAAAAAVEAAGADAAGRRRVAVVLSEEGVATAVPLHSVVEAGLSQRVLFQEDGQPVILEVLDQDQEADAASAEGGDQCATDSAPDDGSSQSWFSSADRAAGDGRQMKTGMWSREEVDTLSANMEQFCRDRGINNPEDIIFRCSKDERKNFYRTVARGINRPLFSIYRRILRMYDHKNHVGRYTDDEVEQLRNLRAIHGNKWQTIGALMGRSAASVKDRVRVLRDNCNQGKWLKEEEERLEQAVYDLTQTLPGQQVTSGINWAAVAQKVITRSEKQCRSKWLNNLSWKTTGGEEWTREDDKHLIDVLSDSGLAEEGDIDWSSLTETWPRNSVRSPQWLRGRWWTLKQQLKNHHRMSFREVLVGLLAMKPRSLLEQQLEAEAAAGLEDTPGSPPPAPAAPQPLIPPGARVFVDQEGRVIPGGSLAVQEDGTYTLDPLAEVGYQGATLVIGGQLYTALPQPLPQHLLVHGMAPGGGQLLLERPTQPLLHHPAVTLQADEPGVALVSAPSLPDSEYADETLRESRLSQQSHTSVIRGDPIMSRTAPGATSEEDESLDCPQ